MTRKIARNRMGFFFVPYFFLCVCVCFISFCFLQKITVTVCRQRQHTMTPAFRNVFLQVDTLTDALRLVWKGPHTGPRPRSEVRESPQELTGAAARPPAAPRGGAQGSPSFGSQREADTVLRSFWEATLPPPTHYLPVTCRGPRLHDTAHRAPSHTALVTWPTLTAYKVFSTGGIRN